MKTRITKFHAAEAQLERALQLYLEAMDYLSAITLAGAADELLGKMLEAEGRTHALGDDLNGMRKVYEHMFEEEIQKKEAVSRINGARDELKHWHDGSDFEMDARIEAYWMIDRAVSNYWRLTSKETARMQRFREKACPAE